MCDVDVCTLCADDCHGHGKATRDHIAFLGHSSSPVSCMCPKDTCVCIDSAGEKVGLGLVVTLLLPSVCRRSSPRSPALLTPHAPDALAYGLIRTLLLRTV